jgi:hypothetical protein
MPRVRIVRTPPRRSTTISRTPGSSCPQMLPVARTVIRSITGERLAVADAGGIPALPSTAIITTTRVDLAASSPKAVACMSRC